MAWLVLRYGAPGPASSHLEVTKWWHSPSYRVLPTPNPQPPLLLYAILSFWLDHYCLNLLHLRPSKRSTLGQESSHFLRGIRPLRQQFLLCEILKQTPFWKLSINLQWRIQGMGPGRTPPPPTLSECLDPPIIYVPDSSDKKKATSFALSLDQNPKIRCFSTMKVV